MKKKTNAGKGFSQEYDFKKPAQFKEVVRRFRKNRTAMVGFCIFAVILLLVLCADLIVDYDMGISTNIRAKLQGPSAEHWFGTDDLGRDILARVLHGGRISLFLGFCTTIASAIMGCLFGCVAGYYGNRVDDLIMRFMDIFSAIPTILMAIAVVAALGNSIPNLILALSIARVPAFTRIVRSAVLSVGNQEYIEASKAGGAYDARILVQHILPNCIGPIIVQTTMNMAIIILQAASLSFLGLGINPPTPEWGAIISSARNFLRTSPHIMLFPGLFLVLSSLSISLLGDGLRDALDPRLKS